MAKYLSGPPGGRTLPLVPPRLSDLEGGVFGPGASVASTGFNAQRPVIKTANARAAGETWEDLLEYYSVRHLMQDDGKSEVKVFTSCWHSVQCGQRRNRLCVPFRQDILPG